MKAARVIPAVVLAVVLVQLAVFVLGGADTECGTSCTVGQRAAGVVLVLAWIEAGILALVGLVLGLGYLVREGARESRRSGDR